MTVPKFRTTSGTAELTTGRPVAIYSSALVGLMNSVAAFRAKGIKHTSKAFAYAGRSAYARWPSQCRFGRRGNGTLSTFNVGPIITTEPSAFASASLATRL